MAEVEMDPELALGLFEEGATLVLLGVPEGTELGIDYNTWQVGPRFRGVKMIPPGLHFLHYSASNRPDRGGEVGPRTGVFLNLKPRDIRLARWDGAEEDLDFSNSQEEEVERVRAGLRDLDRFLGPYPYGTLRKWVSLTDRMTEEGVRSLQPLSGKICAFAQVLPELALRHTQDRLEQNLPSYDSECHSMQEGLERLPKMKQRPGTEMRFSEIPKQNYPEGATPALFLNLKPRDIRLARWDGAEEDLDFSNSQEEEVERVRAGLRDLDRFLGPYPYGTLRKWVSLTDRMTEEGVRSLQPLSGKICAFAQVLPELALRHTQDRLEQNLPSYDSECHSMQEGLERLPKMKQRPGTEMRFSEIPKQNYPEGATPAQITRCSMDLSYALQSVIDRYYKQDPQQILGELQFAFVSFLIGNVYESFEHWQKLVNLLCRSEEAMQRHLSLYLNLISVLYHQLGEIPPDFFVDIVSKDNFLTSTLQEFFSFAAGPDVDATLRKRAEKFKSHLTKKFRWDFEPDPEECAPVVVELPEGVTLD
ncbi:UNVERIFIED_CONTAM: hypothetical protein FKN15_025431 [Acipenser sinensis]